MRLVLMVVTSFVLAHVHDGPFEGKFAQMDELQKKWLRQQKVPGHEADIPPKYCCDEKDGKEAQEDIKDGHYRVLLPKAVYNGAEPYWVDVPDEAVIKAPNLTGIPVAWYWYGDDGKGLVRIRCYAPGTGI